MGYTLNPEFTTFQDIVKEKGFVDKSLLIAELNPLICSLDKYICVTRPRRFGKTIAADMLTEYYSKGCSSRELFSHLKIASNKRIATRAKFDEHINHYNVIRLTMSDYTEYSIKNMEQEIVDNIIQDINDIYPNFKQSTIKRLNRICHDIYVYTQTPFIFIIDEWDSIIRNFKKNEKKQELYLKFLRDFLKDKKYVALVYMTGILPIKKYGDPSSLNMFKEYSMQNQKNLSEFTGFTEKEIKNLCRKFKMNHGEIEKWYNGYNVNEISIYNPYSVFSAMKSHEICSYWKNTDTYEELKTYIILNIDGLREKVERLIAGEHIDLDTESFKNDMVNFQYADDVLTLLLCLGYLTYDYKQKTCWIPNQEVKEEFKNCIKRGGWETLMNAINQSKECLQAILDGDADTVARIIEQTHRENSSIIKYNSENSLANIVLLALYAACDNYVHIQELPTGNGYADIAFLPRPGKTLPAIVIELKKDKNPSIAIDQIKARDYPSLFFNFTGEIILVGISYYSDSRDKNYKKHICKIERITKD